ncbi:MAG: NADH:ubiquinone reductase (Na(+)-transporting) subunit B [Cyclobacteriaceae bacterium]
MRFLREILDKQRPLFEKGGRFEKFYYLFEANETFLFSPDTTTGNKGVQVKDAIDLKRLMMTVVIALVPCLLFGMWNSGHQHFIATGETGSFLDEFWLGTQLVLPIVITAYAAGGLIEVIFAIIRKHPINEGFLVTGMLIPLTLPSTIPLWQVAMATIFAVVIAKEAFGGTGMNILNVALTARAFLYFAYPQQIAGDKVWTYIGDGTTVDGYSGATPLGIAAEATDPKSWIEGTTVLQALETKTAGWADGLYSTWNLIWGAYPGSIGSTSVIMVAIGALVIIATGVGSWKTIVSCFAGGYAMGLLLNIFGSNEFAQIPPYYHLIMGGFAFGAVFMATDPVSSAQTETGKWIYGFLIGVITVIIRVLNPGYPEGIMLAILFMNVFAPLIDFYVVGANKKRRLRRATV